MHKLTGDEMNRLTEDEFRKAEKVPLVVVLDNVRSQHNIGAIFRTADAFRLEKVVLCGLCCTPPNQEIHKTALGAEFSVDWEYYKETFEAVAALRQKGYKVYAVEQVEHSVPLEKFVAAGKTAIVMGHEVFGVKQEVVDAADACIEIPQYGTKHSLNVSVSAGIVMYELANQLRKG